MTADPQATQVYNFFVRTAGARQCRLTSPFWHLLWWLSSLIFSKTTVSTMIHGYPVLLNYGYTYPIYSRSYPLLNQGLVKLIQESFHAKKNPIILVDVGAAIGDTILLALSAHPQIIGKFYAVEGDEEFFHYLENNLRPFKQGRLLNSLLSDKEGEERSLRRIHPGTASAQGPTKLPATTLDHLLSSISAGPIDLLKIDVDGLDGKVLSGAKKILSDERPAVIFEWHPRLYEKTGNDWKVPFEVLTSCGYNRFLWWTKFGAWSHSMQGYDEKKVEEWAQECLRETKGKDWHYDIIALHETSKIIESKLS